MTVTPTEVVIDAGTSQYSICDRGSIVGTGQLIKDEISPRRLFQPIIRMFDELPSETMHRLYSSSTT